MGTLRQDIRYGFRMLLRNPGFTAVVVAVLALGIGANTAVFSVVNSIVLRPLPFQESERLVRLSEHSVSRGWKGVSVCPANFLDWREQNTVFEDMAAYKSSRYTLTGVREPERIQGARVSQGFFRSYVCSPLLAASSFPKRTDREHLALLFSAMDSGSVGLKPILRFLGSKSHWTARDIPLSECFLPNSSIRSLKDLNCGQLLLSMKRLEQKEEITG